MGSGGLVQDVFSPLPSILTSFVPTSRFTTMQRGCLWVNGARLQRENPLMSIILSVCLPWMWCYAAPAVLRATVKSRSKPVVLFKSHDHHMIFTGVTVPTFQQCMSSQIWRLQGHCMSVDHTCTHTHTHTHTYTHTTFVGLHYFILTSSTWWPQATGSIGKLAK